MDHITSSGCIAGAGLHGCARAVRLRQVGVAPEEAGGGVAREAVVTVAAGGVGGGVEDIPALAARSPALTTDEAWPRLDHAAGVGEFLDQRVVPLARARGAVKVLTIGPIAADGRATAGVGDEGVVGGEDGTEGEGVVIRVGNRRAAGGGPRLGGVVVVAGDIVVTNGAGGEGRGADEADGGGGGGRALGRGTVTRKARRWRRWWSGSSHS